MTKHILTKDKFKKWLEGKEAGDTVGYCRNDWRCPVATYLAENYGAGWTARLTRLNKFDERGGKTTYKTPKFAADFIRAVDVVSTPSITAAKALEILEQI